MTMQRKYKLLLVAILLSTAFLQAQDKSKITWGKEVTEPPGTMISKVVSWSNNGFFALRLKNSRQTNAADGPSKVILERYNKSMNLVKSSELSLKHKKKKRHETREQINLHW